jgi:hypothetical protein
MCINYGNYYRDIGSMNTRKNTQWYYLIIMPIFTLSGLFLAINQLMEPFVIHTILSKLFKVKKVTKKVSNEKSLLTLANQDMICELVSLMLVGISSLMDSDDRL